jgi:polyferredoxin
MTITTYPTITDKLDLFRFHYFSRFWRSKYYPLVFQVSLAAILGGMIYNGFFGPTSYTENALTMGAFFAFWWGIIFLMGVMGRSWCAVCPVGAISGAANRFNRGWNFPRKLSNWALPAASYLILLWGLEMVFNFMDTPLTSTIWLVGLIGVAVVMGLLFKGRTFCKYVCPITAPLAVMSRFSPIEVRARTQGSSYTGSYIKNIPLLKHDIATRSSKSEEDHNGGKNFDQRVNGNKNNGQNLKMIDPECKECKTHDCALGNEETEGCPWDQHPSVMMENNACSMCMKCTHSCPSGQPMRLRLRNPLAEVSKVFRPNGGEILIIVILLSYYSIYDWPLLVDLAYPGFSDSLISSLHSYLPFLTEDSVRYYLVGTFFTVGIVLGMYSFASFLSSKVSRINFRTTFNNFGYAYLLIFILPLILSVTIGYVPYYGEFANIILNNIGINMNLKDGFVFEDFAVYQAADYDIKFTEVLYSFPVFFAIPIGIYLVNRIARNLLGKDATRTSRFKMGLPHMILLTLFTLATFYASWGYVVEYT